MWLLVLSFDPTFCYYFPFFLAHFIYLGAHVQTLETFIIECRFMN
jgi:hypothetical protein